MRLRSIYALVLAGLSLYAVAMNMLFSPSNLRQFSAAFPSKTRRSGCRNLSAIFHVDFPAGSNELPEEWSHQKLSYSWHYVVSLTGNPDECSTSHLFAWTFRVNQEDMCLWYHSITVHLSLHTLNIRKMLISQLTTDNINDRTDFRIQGTISPSKYPVDSLIYLLLLRLCVNKNIVIVRGPSLLIFGDYYHYSSVASNSGNALSTTRNILRNSSQFRV